MKNLTITKNENFTEIIAVLNTTPSTVPMMKAAIGEYLPNAKIINFMDDSILGDIKENPASIDFAYEKFMAFAKLAEKQGARIIVNACSTMGEFSTYATGKLKPALVRIDDAVTDVVCDDTDTIAILATIKTTIPASSNQVHAKAGEFAKVDTMLLEDAFNLNAKGDKVGHDKAIADKINSIGDSYDAIFLAQASMADSVKYVKDEYKDKVYTSIPYCVKQITSIAKRITK